MNEQEQNSDLPQTFGYSVIQPQSNGNDRTMMDQRSVRQFKADQARILEAFNSPYYSILEIGAENMLSLEHVGHKAMDIISGSFIIEKWNDFVHTLKQERKELQLNSDNDTITVNKVDIIQKQLDAIVLQMEKVREESKRKSEELEQLRNQVQNSSQGQYQSDFSSQYSQNSTRSRVSLQSGFHNLSTDQAVSPHQLSSAEDNFIMDFSKPAGSVSAGHSTSAPVEEDVGRPVRRRSLEPLPLNEEMPRPPIPLAPPPRRQLLIARSVPTENTESVSRASVGRRTSVDGDNRGLSLQKAALMEEIRNSAKNRILKRSETMQTTEPSEEITQTAAAIVKGNDMESSLMKEQRQKKLSLNDEIRQKMQERLRIMNESDEEENSVLEMD